MKHLPHNLYRRNTNRGPIWHIRFWSEVAGRFVKTTSTGTLNRAEARRIADGILKRGVVPNEEDPALLPYLRDFWTADSAYAKGKVLRGQELSPRHVALSFGAVVRDIEPYTPFKGIRISALTPGIVDRWMLWLKDWGRGPRTINIALQALRVAVRRWARAHRFPDPMEGVQKAEEQPHERGSLSLTEIRALIECRTDSDTHGKKQNVDPRVRAGVASTFFLLPIRTRGIRVVLLVTSETYSKFINVKDRSVRTLFGDAAAATLIRAKEQDGEPIGPFVFGTDGEGAGNLIVPTGGLRGQRIADAEIEVDASGNSRSVNDLFMNGPEIFSFTLQSVPQAVARLLEKSGNKMEDIDKFVFHQANRYMLDHLQKKLKIEEDKFIVSFKQYGNTVSSTIRIALRDGATTGRILPGDLVMIVGFGVGYSWRAPSSAGMLTSRES